MKFLKIFSELSVSRLSVVALLFTVGYYFMYYNDGATIVEQTKGIQTQLDAEKAKRIEIERKMKKEEEMRGNLLQLARNLDIVKSKIPNEFNEIEVSSIVNRASAAAQVKISMLKRSGGDAKGIGSATGAELIDEVRFDVEMTGSFNGIIAFVEQLSREEKTIKIRNFSIDKIAGADLQEDGIRFRGEIVGFKQTISTAKAGK